MNEDRTLEQTLQQLATALKQRGWMLSTAESCTGGLIAAACTEQPGSSEWFDGGFVTYSNTAKTQMLGVPATLIEQHGAVSQPVVAAMAHGAVQRSRACASVAVTGVAGPGGGSTEKPVGTVWIGWATPSRAWQTCFHLGGERQQVRKQTVRIALQQLLQALDKDSAQ